jgi:hypothetical protein
MLLFPVALVFPARASISQYLPHASPWFRSFLTAVSTTWFYFLSIGPIWSLSEEIIYRHDLISGKYGDEGPGLVYSEGPSHVGPGIQAIGDYTWDIVVFGLLSAIVWIPAILIISLTTNYGFQAFSILIKKATGIEKVK